MVGHGPGRGAFLGRHPHGQGALEPARSAGFRRPSPGFSRCRFVCFLVLLLGKDHLFPWLHEDLHGKEVWLNIPFLFTRDGIGLLILYGLRVGLPVPGPQAEARHGRARQPACAACSAGRIPQNDAEIAARSEPQERCGAASTALRLPLVLSLIGFDLVMSMDPHWVSTLFGAYHFVKAFYVGLGALIILAAIVHLRRGGGAGIAAAHFHDIGKLFFAFCLLWADFFYVQLTVIWYGNIPEETHYVILRTVTAALERAGLDGVHHVLHHPVRRAHQPARQDHAAVP